MSGPFLFLPSGLIIDASERRPCELIVLAWFCLSAASRADSCGKSDEAGFFPSPFQLPLNDEGEFPGEFPEEKMTETIGEAPTKAGERDFQ